MKSLLCLCRIIGDTAHNDNIIQSVGEQMQKTFAKSKWKVREGRSSILSFCV